MYEEIGFKYRPEFARKYGIDCIIEGEGEKVIGT